MTLAQAAFNADETVEQVAALLAGAAETMGDLNTSVDSIDATMVRFSATLGQIEELAPRLIDMMNRMEALVDRVEMIVGVGETLVSPIAATEQALRGVVNTVRSKNNRKKDGHKKADH